MIAMNSKHLWSVIIASEDSYDSHDQWSHMIAMNTDCEQSLFIGTAMNLDSERSMIKHIIHDEVGSMLWNAGVHTWSTLILYHIMTPKLRTRLAGNCQAPLEDMSLFWCQLNWVTVFRAPEFGDMLNMMSYLQLNHHHHCRESTW